MDDLFALSTKNICKSFGPTKAVVDFSFELKRGEIRGLIGENGSGKSTFTSIIAGIQPADSGTMSLLGEEFIPINPVDANDKGVAMIMQEIGTISDTTVADNIFVGKEKQFSKMGIIDYKKMYATATEILKKVGIENINPALKVNELNLEERKIIEIAKATVGSTKLLIVDETSNALAKRGRDILYKSISEIKENGNSVIFITHDMNELMEICDSVTIMRDGLFVATLEKSEMEINCLKELMVGREISQNYYRTDYDSAKKKTSILKVQNLKTNILNDVSFELQEGEILGIGGLADSGMHELGRVVFGLDEAVEGKVIVEATGKKIATPHQAIQSGIGYMSKNRDSEALVLQMSIRDNICISALNKISRRGIISPKAEMNFVNNLADRLSIKMNSISQYVTELSGGNKQKVVLAKWIGNGSKILIMDCPTRGIDIGVKESIYQLMTQLKNKGHSMIMISEELPELIGMSDRMIIMKNGRIQNIYDRSRDITEDVVIKDMI